MTHAQRVRRAVEDAHRRDWALVLGATMRVARDVDLAEECVQEAYAQALAGWKDSGIPDNPAAWLTATAKRRALDAHRHARIVRDKLPLLLGTDDEDAPAPPADEYWVADERLRLMLLCCHPALPSESRTALTLRLVNGLTTAEIAAAFLVPEPTMAARITRAKRKIAGAGIPFRVPPKSELPGRLSLVAEVIYLVYTAGHTAAAGDTAMRTDLTDEAARLSAILHDLAPEDPEVAGLRALILAHEARRAGRLDDDGDLLRLHEQDRDAWDREAIARARTLVMHALPHVRAGRFALQAAIAVLHAEGPDDASTDWPQILGLYDRLLDVWDSPVVALNRLVAVARVHGPDAALTALEEIEAGERLRDYPYLFAVKGELLHHVGRAREASVAFRRASEIVVNERTRAVLERRAELL